MARLLVLNIAVTLLLVAAILFLSKNTLIVSGASRGYGITVVPD